MTTVWAQPDAQAQLALAVAAEMGDEAAQPLEVVMAADDCRLIVAEAEAEPLLAAIAKIEKMP